MCVLLSWSLSLPRTLSLPFSVCVFYSLFFCSYASASTYVFMVSERKVWEPLQPTSNFRRQTLTHGKEQIEKCMDRSTAASARVEQHLATRYVGYRVHHQNKEICEALGSINVMVDEDEMVQIHLGGLTQWYGPIRTAICTREKSPSLFNLPSMLMVKENHMSGSRTTQPV